MFLFCQAYNVYTMCILFVFYHDALVEYDGVLLLVGATFLLFFSFFLLNMIDGG